MNEYLTPYLLFLFCHVSLSISKLLTESFQATLFNSLLPWAGPSPGNFSDLVMNNNAGGIVLEKKK